MAEAKVRLLAAEKVSKSNTPVTGFTTLDSEFCFLQIRKIIELITFSAIKREESRYTKLREQDHEANSRDHGNPAKDWHAPEILKRLVTLSPHALPIPFAKVTKSGPGQTHFERNNISVSHGRLIELYEKCGGFMHAKNPLVDDYLSHVESERSKNEAAPEEVRRALKFLRKLLWQHVVVQLDWSDPENPKVVDDPVSAWIVDFGVTNDAQIKLIIGAAT